MNFLAQILFHLSQKTDWGPPLLRTDRVKLQWSPKYCNNKQSSDIEIADTLRKELNTHFLSLQSESRTIDNVIRKLYFPKLCVFIYFFY